MLYQDAPIRGVAGFDVPTPLHANEDYFLPQEFRDGCHVRQIVSRNSIER